MKGYYSRRAAEYEAIYRRNDPVRQRELAQMGAALEEAVRGKRVLEVACGTGFWTEQAAKTALYITAVDAAPETLAIARSKNLAPDKVDFRVGDAYALDAIGGSFTAGLAMFWISHVPRSRMEEFLRGFHSTLQEGSKVFLADNILQEGVGGTLIRKPGIEDTFKRRTLKDGSVHDVLKNYYDRPELEALLLPFATNVHIEIGTCFYWVSFTASRRLP